jgi:hypothetical protein
VDDAHVAQPVEHFLGKEEVTGSIPVVGFHIPGVEQSRAQVSSMVERLDEFAK